MPRSVKDSDDEAESKTGRMPTRMLSTSVVNSPLRRSSRIKQAKTSPGSESDSSNNYQPIRVQPARLTRQRTATMDSIVSETVKKRLTRHTSASSGLNEDMDIDVVETPTKRGLRRSSLSAIASTDTNINTRATNKRLTRAGSEAKLSPHVRVVRKTRSSSVEPESLQEKSQPSTPIRIQRKRASILPSGSPVQEETEERTVTPVRLTTTITEMDEFLSYDKVAVVPVLLKSDEILSLSQNKNKIESKHADQETMDKKQTDVEGQLISEESLPFDDGASNNSIHNSPNLLKSKKESLSEENLLQIEQSLIAICQESPTKESAEKSSNTSIEVQKNSPSNKENQTSNIMSGGSAKKNLQPVISNVVSLTPKLSSASVDKLDEKENDSEETNKISFANETETQERDVSKKNLDADIVDDSNEMNLMLEEPSQDENKALSDATNINSSSESPINKAPFENSEDQSDVMDKQTAADDLIDNDAVQDDVIDNAKSTEQEEENLSKRVRKSSSDIPTITLESTDSDVNDTTVQEDPVSEISKKPADILDTSDCSIISISLPPAELPQKAESKNVSLESTSQDIVCDASETGKESEAEEAEEAEAEEESAQLKKNKNDQKGMESVDSEVITTLKYFQDIPVESSDEDDGNNVKMSSANSDQEAKQESETECDLILVDKQAWLAAENMRAQKEKEVFDYDSDDTVLLKSQLDAARANSQIETLDTVSEECEIDVENEDNAFENGKKRKLTKRRSIFERNKNSSPECTDDEVSVVKCKVSLNQSNKSSTSRLNNSKQAAKATEQAPEEEAEDGLNRSSQVNKNVSLRKSTGRRKSLNKSLTNTSSNQNENNKQIISANQSKMDISEEEIDTDTLVQINSQIRRSLNKSYDDEVTECEKNSNEDDENASLNRSANNKSKLIQEISNSEGSNNKRGNETSKNSTVAPAETNTDNNASIESLETRMSLLLSRSNDDSENNNDDDTDNNSITSDIRREYNLDGMEPNFSDDNLPGDECRASESEYSDVDDSGSDLDSFIVSDNDVEETEEDNEDDDDEEGVDIETSSEEGETENKMEDDEDGVDIETSSEEGETENKMKDDDDEDEEVDIQTTDTPTVNKGRTTYINKMIKSLEKIESSTPKLRAGRCAFWINEIPDTPVKAPLERSANFAKGHTSLKETNRTSNKEKRLNKSLPSDLPNLENQNVSKSKNLETFRLHKTMSITDDDMSTIRHLRKEKLNESAPLRFNTKITPLQKKVLLREKTRTIMQTETKEENNEEDVSSPVTLSTEDAVQNRSRQKRRNKQAKQASNEDVIEQDQEDIEPKTKIELANRSPMPVVRDATGEKQLNKTKKKKKKQIGTIEQNEDVTEDKTANSTPDIQKKKKKKKQIDTIEQNEDVTEDKTANSTPDIQKKKKKKLVQQPTMLIANDSNSKDSDQINEKKKKKKKQIGIIEQEESTNEDKIKIRKNGTKLAQDSRKKTDKVASSLQRDSSIDDRMFAKKKEREAKEALKNRETLSEESTKNVAQIKKKKTNKKEVSEQMPISDDIAQKRSQKKRKRQIEEALNENTDDEAASRPSQDPTERKKKIKRIKFDATAEEIKFTQQRQPVTWDNTYEDLDQIGEKKKKKKQKQAAATEQNKNVNEENLSTATSKKYIERPYFLYENVYSQMYETDDSPSGLGTLIDRRSNKKRLASIEQDNNIRKNDTQPTGEKKKKKKKQLASIEQDNNAIEVNAAQSVGEKKKKKKKQLASIEQDIIEIDTYPSDNNIMEVDTYAPQPAGEKKKKKKKQQQSSPNSSKNEEEAFALKLIREAEENFKPLKIAFECKRSSPLALRDNPLVRESIEKKKKGKFASMKQDNNIMEVDTYAPQPAGEKKKKKKKQQQPSPDSSMNEEEAFALKLIREAEENFKPLKIAFKCKRSSPLASRDNPFVRESIEKKKKGKLASMQQDNNIMEDDTHASQPIGEKNKKKKKQLASIEQDNNIIEVDAPQSVGEKKKKKKKQLASIEQDIIETDTYTSEPVGEKKKKKKRQQQQLDVIQQDYNMSEDDTYAPETIEKKKKKKEKKQLGVIGQQGDINEDDVRVPMLAGEKKKKKNKERQIEQESSAVESNPKLKPKKNLKSGEKLQVQNTPNPVENSAFSKAWDEAQEAICAAQTRIKINKELKKKKRPEDEARNVKVKERKKLTQSSVDSVKRLPNDVVENLSDIPKKKKRKFLREEETSDSPKTKKPKATTKRNDSERSLNVPGSSTQFTVVNLEKAKKQLKGSAAMAASLRQKMLDRNKREPVSAYIMYLEKQRAERNKKPMNTFF